MGMSADPEQVGKKQDDNECASRFKLFEEPGQKVSENKDLKSVCQCCDYRSKRTEAGISFWLRGSIEGDGNGYQPGKNEQDHRFGDHSLSRRRFFGFVSTFFDHEPKIAVPVLTVESKQWRRALFRAREASVVCLHEPKRGRYLTLIVDMDSKIVNQAVIQTVYPAMH